MKTITITITPDGEQEIDLSGFHGQGCAKALADFSAGDIAKIVRNKSEFYERLAEQIKAQS